MSTQNDSNQVNGGIKPVKHPFRAAVLRGMGVVTPPLLTVLIFVWIIDTTNHYVLQKLTNAARWAIVELDSDIRTKDELPKGDPSLSPSERPFQPVGDDTYVPTDVYNDVKEVWRDETDDMSAREIYERYVDLTYLQPYKTVPFFLALFILVLYLLGKFMAAGMGYFFWHRFERGIHRLPLIRNVYSSVKQVSDFLFSEREVEYMRVVAVEYPRHGIWSLGLVTGESMLDIRSAANEPVLSVLMCTSPMPMTGFTVTVAKRECLDLNITIDQAFQFIISCGVVVPPQQMQEMLEEAKAIEESSDEQPADESDEPERLEAPSELDPAEEQDETDEGSSAP